MLFLYGLALLISISGDLHFRHIRYRPFGYRNYLFPLGFFNFSTGRRFCQGASDRNVNRACVRLLSRLCAPAVLVPCRRSSCLCRLLPVPLGYREPFLPRFQAVLFAEICIFLVLPFQLRGFLLVILVECCLVVGVFGIIATFLYRHYLTFGVPDAVFKLSLLLRKIVCLFVLLAVVIREGICLTVTGAVRMPAVRAVDSLYIALSAYAEGRKTLVFAAFGVKFALPPEVICVIVLLGVPRAEMGRHKKYIPVHFLHAGIGDLRA